MYVCLCKSAHEILVLIPLQKKINKTKEKNKLICLQ